jgi:hypothetical protein
MASTPIMSNNYALNKGFQNIRRSKYLSAHKLMRNLARIFAAVRSAQDGMEPTRLNA